MNKNMELAKNCAYYGIRNHEGGPFGAVILNSNLEIIATGNNRVLCENDPTAHAEIIAIRDACKKMGTYDLSGCILYTSCEPCPMCLSAIIWSNIKKVYYGCNRKDASNIGFRDDFIYEYLEGKNKKALDIQCLDREECLKVFEEYKKNYGMIY